MGLYRDGQASLLHKTAEHCERHRGTVYVINSKSWNITLIYANASTDKDSILRIESFAAVNLRGVSKKLWKLVKSLYFCRFILESLH